MKCNKCGEEVSDASKFCPECGNKIVNNESIKVVDSKTSTKKSKINKKINLILLIVAVVFVIGIFLFIKFGGYKKDDPVKTTNAITQQTQEVEEQSDTNNQDKTQNTKISEQECTEKVRKISGHDDILLKGSGIASSKEIKCADELVGKMCYYFGYSQGNGIFYVVNAENGDVYECTSKDAGVMTLVHAQQRVSDADKIKSQENKQNEKQQSTNKASTTSNSTGINYTINSIKYSEGLKESSIEIIFNNTGNRYFMGEIRIKFYNSNNEVIGDTYASITNVLQPNQSVIATTICQGNVKNYDHFYIEEQMVDTTKQTQMQQDANNYNAFK